MTPTRTVALDEPGLLKAVTQPPLSGALWKVKSVSLLLTNTPEIGAYPAGHLTFFWTKWFPDSVNADVSFTMKPVAVVCALYDVAGVDCLASPEFTAELLPALLETNAPSAAVAAAAARHTLRARVRRGIYALL